ncbi:MAG: hypothetical protein ACD_75C02457G0001 [uncultured bacterium]|nr:MAG: hypothetical protein ACD_75C02457G0001 [uncultured bacterium]
MELIVEMMGDGPGHPAQAFSLLQLPVLSLQFPLYLFRLHTLGNIEDHSLFGDGSVGMVYRRIDHIIPTVIFRALHFPANGFALLDPVIDTPGAD